MKNKRSLLVVFIIITLLGITYVIYAKNKPGFVFLNGMVTSYDETPSYSDGPIIFSIDNKMVDIGGGLRAGSPGEVYSPIKVGDKVKAKVMRDENGELSIYDCESCYIRKQ